MQKSMEIKNGKNIFWIHPGFLVRSVLLIFPVLFVFVYA